ncbi:hypothetical protein QJS10_CPA07g01080 [Acorus calamus]|uniref:RRM domain-containing protein n=1 Tax=Acorus calamus TaxID=4465 RepID=A0AAV9EGB0_ACOCL|nr:hypothetical protein QJS10_CPA07g01080 [Acorus calamus]
MGQFGDTTLTKVFVGGLAWETQKEMLGDHFEKYGEILEAVIISDKATGRSKGYGFVTFKEAEGAKKACEDSTPVINGRKANCNLASLGAKRVKQSPLFVSQQTPAPAAAPPPPPPTGMNVGGPRVSASPAGPGQWFYPAHSQSPYPQQHPHYQAFPFYPYGYSASYMTDISYNHKLSHSGGSYMHGQFSQAYPMQGMLAPNTTALLPMYPYYQYHQSQTMGVPAHVFPPTTAGPITSIPTIISKPAAMAPAAVCLAVE